MIEKRTCKKILDGLKTNVYNELTGYSYCSARENMFKEGCVGLEVPASVAASKTMAAGTPLRLCQPAGETSG